MSFGNWLRRELEARGLTMSEFGRRVGVSHATVSRWISGGHRPDLDTVDRISRTLGVDSRHILERVGYSADALSLPLRLDEEIEQLRKRRDTIQIHIDKLENERSDLDRQIANKEAEVRAIRREEEIGDLLLEANNEELWQLWHVFESPYDVPPTEELLRRMGGRWTPQQKQAFWNGVVTATELLLRQRNTQTEHDIDSNSRDNDDEQ